MEISPEDLIKEINGESEQESNIISPDDLIESVKEVPPEEVLKEIATTPPVPKQDSAKAISKGIAQGWKGLKSNEQRVTYDELMKIEEEIKKGEQKFGGDKIGIKIPFVNPKINPLEPVIAPVGEAWETFKKTPGIVKGVEAGVRAAGKRLAKEVTETAITSDELTDKRVVRPDPENPDLFIVDREKLSKTMYPTEKLLNEEADAILRNNGLEGNKKAKQELMALAAIRGSSSDPTVKGSVGQVLRATGEVLDAAFFNAPSRFLIDSVLKSTELLKKPQNVNLFDTDEIESITNLIYKAKEKNTPVQWQSKRFGDVTITPEDTVSKLEDYMYAKNMSLNITNFVDKNKTGLLQFTGNMAIELLLRGAMPAIPWLATLSSKVPAVAKAVKPKIVSEYVLPIAGATFRTAAEAAAMGVGAVVGENVQEERLQAMLDSFAMAAGLNVTGYGIHKGVTSAISYGNKMKMLREVREGVDADAFVDAVRKSATFDEYKNNPNNAGFKVNVEDFNAAKEIVTFHDKNMLDRLALVRGIEEENHYDPATQQGVREFIKRANSPEATPTELKLKENVETYYALTHDMTTIQEGRVEAALLATFEGRHQLDEQKGRAEYKKDKARGRTLTEEGFINIYRPFLSDPEKVIEILQKKRSDLVEPFKGHIKSPFFSPEAFMFRAYAEALDSTHMVTPENVGALSRSLEGKSTIYNELAAKYDLADTGAIKNEILGRIEGLKKNIAVNQKNVETQKRVSLSFLDELNEIAISKKAPVVSNFINSVADYVQKEMPITAGIKEQLNSVVEILNPSNKVLNALDSFNSAMTNRDKTIADLGEYQALHTNFDPVSVPNRKINYLTKDADRMAYALLRNSSPENLMYVKNTFFNGEKWHEDFQPIAKSLFYNKLPNRQSVADEIATIELLMQQGMGEIYSNKQTKALANLLPVLKSYEKDIGHYKEAYQIKDIDGLNIISRLSALRNNLDAIKNPVLAKEIHDLIQNRRGEFLEQMESSKIKLSVTEQEAIWEWATGSNAVRLKQMMTNYAVLNTEMLNSMFKATNELGKEMIDLYGEAYAAQFGSTLDRNAFHAYFLTAANDFDKKSGILAALFVEMQKVKELKDSIISNKVKKALITTYGNMDYVERAIESVTQMSLGTHLSDLNNSVRGAKRSIDDFLQNELAPVLMRSEAYLNIEHPTFDVMSKKAKGLDGFDGYLFIDKRKQNGSHELTPFGRFLTSIFKDEVFLKELNDELSRVEYSPITGDKVLQGYSKEAHELLSKKAVAEGFVDIDARRSKEKTIESDMWATQILTYWGDVFSMKDAPKLWNILLDWRAQETKLMASAFERANNIIKEMNAREAQRGGAQFPLLLWREQRIENRLKFTDSNFTPYEAQYRDIRLERSYGTAKWAQTINAKDFNLSNTQNVLESFFTDIVANLTGAHTQHARSALLPLIHNMERFGYKAPAEYLINKAALGQNTILMLESFNAEALIDKLKSNPVGQFLVVPWRAMSPWVMPFLALNNLESLTRGATEAMNTSMIYGPRSAWKTPIKMALAVPLGVAQRVLMTLFYNRKGEPRYASVPWIYGEPRYKAAVSRVKANYRDAVHNEFILNLHSAIQEGKTFGALEFKDIPKQIGGLTDKTNLFALTLLNKSAKTAALYSKFIFENLKERYEMYTSTINLNKGARFAQFIETLMRKGDFDGAYAATQNALQFFTRPKIFEIYKEMETAFKRGNFENSLDSFLTAFHDSTTGRFGPTTVPEVVKVVGRYVPMYGLFHSAINLDIFRVLGMGANVFSNLPESKGARVLFVKMLAAQYATNTALNWAGGGASEEASNDLLPKDVRFKLKDPMKEWETKTFFAKLLAEGYLPFKAGDWTTPVSKLMFEDNNKISAYNMAASMLGFTSAMSGRGIKVPLGGMQLEAAWGAGTSLWEYVESRRDVPDILAADLDASEKYNLQLSRVGSEHYKKFVEAIKTAKTAEEMDRAKVLFQNWQRFAGATVLDKFWHIGPTEIFTQNIVNPIYMYQLLSDLKEIGAPSLPVMVKNMRGGKLDANAQIDELKHKLFDAPVSNVLNFSPLNQKEVLKSLLKIDAETPDEVKNIEASHASIAPQFVKDIYAEIYQKLGLARWNGSPESFAAIMDDLMIFASETGIIKNPEFVKYMAEQGKKNYKLMFPKQPGDVEAIPEKTMQKLQYDKIQKGD